MLFLGTVSSPSYLAELRALRLAAATCDFPPNRGLVLKFPVDGPPVRVRHPPGPHNYFRIQMKIDRSTTFYTQLPSNETLSIPITVAPSAAPSSPLGGTSGPSSCPSCYLREGPSPSHAHFLRMRTGHFASFTIRSSTGLSANLRKPPGDVARIMSNEASTLSRRASDSHCEEYTTFGWTVTPRSCARPSKRELSCFNRSASVGSLARRCSPRMRSST